MSQLEDEKVTYVSAGLSEGVHAAFEKALGEVTGQLGQRHGFYVNEVRRDGDGRVSVEQAPGDRDLVIGAFAQPSPADVDEAVEVAARAQKSWADRPWTERVELLRKAAEGIAAHRYELAALVTLEVGKTRLEALGDVDETIELITLYCKRMEQRDGFLIRMTDAEASEEAESVMRPYGVWGVISPFNFPLPLAAGPAAAAMVTGNTVILKPSYQGYLLTLRLYDEFISAGIPPDVVQVLPGDGAAVGDALVRHQKVAGITFTGSHAVGMHILRESAARPYPRPVIAEMGGKNATLVTASADVGSAASGIAKAAFGFSGQKCSACSRVYVDSQVADELVTALEGQAKQLRVANPILRESFTGPVTNQKAVERYLSANEQAKREGRLVCGGKVLDAADTPSGQYVALAVAEIDGVDSTLLTDELFVPFVAVQRVKGLAEGIERMNRSSFGLTAGLFSTDQGEIDAFLNQAQAGVLYVNRAAGSTTGAWPGVQTFGGWKGSGTTSRGTGGHYYVQQYLREQSRTIMHD